MPPAESVAPWPSVGRPHEQPRGSAGSRKQQNKQQSKRPPKPSTSTPQRQGDRGDGEDEAHPLFPTFCRFADLVTAGVTSNWPHLLRLIDCEGFPVGVMLSRNIRAWDVDEVRRWLAERPTARKVVKPATKPRRRKRQEDAAAASAPTP